MNFDQLPHPTKLVAALSLAMPQCAAGFAVEMEQPYSSTQSQLPIAVVQRLFAGSLGGRPLPTKPAVALHVLLC